MRKEDPIITCRPWKPVATKKVDPNTESAIVKEASTYSYACKIVNKTPNKIVHDRLDKELECSLVQIALWVQVTVTPEVRRIIVLSNGTSNGLKGVT
jgi:hypothetical protein